MSTVSLNIKPSAGTQILEQISTTSSPTIQGRFAATSEAGKAAAKFLLQNLTKASAQKGDARVPYPILIDAEADRDAGFPKEPQAFFKAVTEGVELVKFLVENHTGLAVNVKLELTEATFVGYGKGPGARINLQHVATLADRAATQPTEVVVVR